MDDYLTKPLNPSKLVRCIEAWEPSPGTISSPVPPPTVPVADLPGLPAAQVSRSNETTFDFDALLARCEGDKDMLARLLQLFDKQSRPTWSGLLASYQSRDAAAVARFAHALKGMAANLSAARVAGLAAQLEQLGRSANLDAAETVVQEVGIELLTRCRNCFCQFWSRGMIAIH